MADAKKKLKFYWTNLNKTKDGKAKDGKITVKAEGATQVWLKRDDEKGRGNAPYHFRKVKGDFTASVKLTCKMDVWLDQAGILLQEKPGIYTKCALSYHDDPSKVGNHHYFAEAYVHQAKELEMYDNTTPYPKQMKRPDKKYDFVQLETDPKEKGKLWLKVTRKAMQVICEYSLDGSEWHVLRTSEFSRAHTLSVGIFAASGDGESKGIKATFEELIVEEDPDWVDNGDNFGFVEFVPVEAEEKEDALPMVNFLRKAEEEEEEKMMARLSALQAGLGDAPTSDDDLFAADASEPGLDLGEMDVSAQMREMEALRSSIMGGGGLGDDDDGDDDDDVGGLLETSVSDQEEPATAKKSAYGSDSDDDSDDE